MASVKETVKPAAATVSGYSTDKQLYATRYKQGGRTVYAVAMTPAQIAATVKRPDPLAENPGNRRIRLKHAQEFARYFIEREGWVVPGIILRSPNIFTFKADNEIADVQFGLLQYADRNQGDIHILDGQHRILGFHIALEVVDDLLDKARSQKATARRQEQTADSPRAAGPLERAAQAEIDRLDKVRDRLYSERVTVEIQVTDNQREYRQMFFDIAENALGITASVKARFDNTKVVNRALPDVLEHPLLAARVELENDRLPRASANVMTAKHVVEIMRVANVGFDGRFGRRYEREAKEATVAKNATDFFDVLVESFPPMKAVELGQILPDALRATSLLGSPLFLRILAGAFYDLTQKHGWDKVAVSNFFAKVAPHVNDPAHENSIWQTRAPEGSYKVGAMSPVGRRQDSRALVDALVEWALDDPSFLTEAPLPAPEPEEAPEATDEEILAGLEVAAAAKQKLTGAAAEMALEQDEIAKESKARGRARSTAKKR